jgi:hypothetical protein
MGARGGKGFRLSRERSAVFVWFLTVFSGELARHCWGGGVRGFMFKP